MKKKNTFNISFVLTELLLLFVLSSSYGMIEELPIEKLCDTSDLIVVARVIDKNINKVNILNMVYVKDVLKGKWDKKQILFIKTGRPIIEDTPVFPSPCTDVLLFLKRDRKGGFYINNLLQGLMIINENGDLLGFGTGLTIKDIKKIIKSNEKRIQKPIKSYIY